MPESAMPESAVPEPAVPESAVPEPAVPEPAVPESAVPESVTASADVDAGVRQGTANPPSAGGRIGLLPLVLATDIPVEVDDIDARLTAQVREAFARSDPELVMLSAEQSGDAAAPYCGDAVCWQALATQFGVTHFLVARVTFSDPDYRVMMQLVDGLTGEMTSETDRACDLCGLAELGTQVGDMAATMRREIEAEATEPPRLVVTSVPAGAEVELDGEVIGLTPISVDTVSGVHRITLRRGGYVVAREEVELLDGVERRMETQLLKLPVDTAAVPSRPATASSGLIWGGVAGIVVGLGGIAGGATMVALHEQPIARDCEGENVDALGRCRYLHDTRAGGIALLVVGGISLVGGVVLLATGGARRRSDRRAQLRPGGLAVRF